MRRRAATFLLGLLPVLALLSALGDHQDVRCAFVSCVRVTESNSGAHRFSFSYTFLPPLPFHPSPVPLTATVCDWLLGQ